MGLQLARARRKAGETGQLDEVDVARVLSAFEEEGTVKGRTRTTTFSSLHMVLLQSWPNFSILLAHANLLARWTTDRKGRRFFERYEYPALLLPLRTLPSENGIFSLRLSAAAGGT